MFIKINPRLCSLAVVSCFSVLLVQGLPPFCSISHPRVFLWALPWPYMNLAIPSVYTCLIVQRANGSLKPVAVFKYSEQEITHTHTHSHRKLQSRKLHKQSQTKSAIRVSHSFDVRIIGIPLGFLHCVVTFLVDVLRLKSSYFILLSNKYYKKIHLRIIKEVRT